MKRLGLPFRVALLALVLGSLFVTVGAIGTVAYFFIRHSAEDLKGKHYALVSEATSLEVRRLLEPVPRILLEYRTLARRGMLPLDDPVELGAVLAERLRTRDFLGWLSYSDRATGSFIGAWRREDGSIVLNRSRPDIDQGRPSEVEIDERGRRTPLDRKLPLGYDPRTRPWFRQAIESPDIVWSKPYLFQEGQPGLTASLSYTIPGETVPAGVFTADFFLTNVSSYLHDVLLDRHGYVVVMAPTGETIGSAFFLEGDENRFYHAMSAAMPVTPAALRPGEPSQFGFARDGESFSGVATAFHLPGGLHYVVAVVGRESEFLGVARRNARLVFLVGLGATFLCGILAVVLSNRIARPLRMLSEDLREVGKFNLQALPSPHSEIREIAVVWDSVARMKAGLRSFRRYVPEALVLDLLRKGKDAALGAQKRTLTILFSDVEGFTRMSESLEPEEVFAELSGYLETTTQVVETERGTLDKFMGDGALALFNAPEELADHAIHACRAALEIQSRLERADALREQRGEPILRIRTGLHTGEALVGNIGTRERFSYTALGDSVNLANRLQALNKDYGTRILVSEQTYEQARDEFEWRHLDRVTVSGRTGPTNVYELLGARGSLTEAARQARTAYEEGLTASLRGDLGAAAASFRSAYELQPQDIATAVMMTRISTVNPPVREPSSLRTAPLEPS